MTELSKYVIATQPLSLSLVDVKSNTRPSFILAILLRAKLRHYLFAGLTKLRRKVSRTVSGSAVTSLAATQKTRVHILAGT